MREFSIVVFNPDPLFPLFLVIPLIQIFDISIIEVFSNMSETNIILFVVILIIFISFCVNKVRVSSYGITKEFYFMPFINKQISWSQIKYYAHVDERERQGLGLTKKIEKAIWLIDFNDRVCLRLKKSKRKNFKKILDVIDKFEDKYIDDLEIKNPVFMRHGWTKVTYNKKIEND
tara:strand:- start:126 stop:650 length:525 start_codon:yes stop_codon:yes gene_type:complete